MDPNDATCGYLRPYAAETPPACTLSEGRAEETPTHARSFTREEIRRATVRIAKFYAFRQVDTRTTAY